MGGLEEKIKVEVDEQDGRKEEHEGGRDFYEYKF
jgi:hypothetical protein